MDDIKSCAIKRTIKSACIWVGIPAIIIIIGAWLMICEPYLLLGLIVLALIIFLIIAIVYVGYDIIKRTYESHLSDCMDECRERKRKEGFRKI